MGLKKAWIFNSSIPSPLVEELEADGYTPGPSSCSFVEKHTALEMYSLSASGDLTTGNEYDWPRVSVAACAHELKSRMKRIKGRRSHSHSFATAYIDGETQREPGLFVKKAGGGWSKETRRLPTNDSTPHIEQRRVVSDPVVLDTVDDLLRHLERIGRLRPSLSSFSASASASTSSLRPNLESEAGDINSQSLAESETEGDCSFASQSSVDTESIATDSDSDHGHDHELLFGESEEAVAEDVQNLLSSIPGASCSPQKSPSKRTSSTPQERATLAAHAASIRAFATYHAERDREFGIEGGDDELFADFNPDEAFGSKSPGWRQTLISTRAGAHRGNGARRPRKAAPLAY